MQNSLKYQNCHRKKKAVCNSKVILMLLRLFSTRELLAQHTPWPEGAEKTKFTLRAALQRGCAPPWGAQRAPTTLLLCYYEFSHGSTRQSSAAQGDSPATAAATKHDHVPCPGCQHCCTPGLFWERSWRKRTSVPKALPEHQPHLPGNTTSPSH